MWGWGRLPGFNSASATHKQCDLGWELPILSVLSLFFCRMGNVYTRNKSAYLLWELNKLKYVKCLQSAWLLESSQSTFSCSFSWAPERHKAHTLWTAQGGESLSPGSWSLANFPKCVGLPSVRSWWLVTPWHHHCNTNDLCSYSSNRCVPLTRVSTPWRQDFYFSCSPLCPQQSARYLHIVGVQETVTEHMIIIKATIYSRPGTGFAVPLIFLFILLKTDH